MTVIKRGSSYGVRVKRGGKQHWIGTYPTLAKARRAEAEARVAQTTDTSKLTVSELADLYHQQHTAHKESATQKNYKRATKAFVAHSADRRASSVTFIEAQAFANNNARSTVDAVSTMYEWAKKAGIVTANPFDGVTRVQVRPKREAIVLTDQQVSELAGVALRELDPPMAEQMAAMILFAAGTGMRPAEIFALTWRDIDTSNNRVNVSKSLAADGVKLPKNGKPREIALLSTAREGLTLIERGVPDDLIFTSNRGNALSKSKLAYRWHQVRRAAGLPSMPFYNLRHTCATRLLELGAYSYEVAEQLGHQDGGRLVERTYGHPSTKRALDRITELDRVATERPVEFDGVATGVAKGVRSA